jgi:hypothetical protein
MISRTILAGAKVGLVEMRHGTRFVKGHERVDAPWMNVPEPLPLAASSRLCLNILQLRSSAVLVPGHITSDYLSIMTRPRRDRASKLLYPSLKEYKMTLIDVDRLGRPQWLRISFFLVLPDSVRWEIELMLHGLCFLSLDVPLL